MPDSPQQQQHEDEDRGVLVSFLALGFALLLVVLGVWLFTSNHQNQDLQHCYMENRRDCEPLDTTAR
jgi:hypothetical protein